MDVREPRVRRRGFFLHSSDGEADSGEHENPEGLTVRARSPRSRIPRKTTSSPRTAGASISGRRSNRDDGDAADARPAIRSGSVTGSRQRAHLPR